MSAAVVPAIIAQHTEILPINTKRVKHHPENPRRGNIDLIRESIRVNGFYGAVLVQKSTGYIVIGNHRYRAAKLEKMKELPFTFVDVDDRTARRMLAVDNRSNDAAGYDDQALAVLLENIMNEDEGLEGSGYDDESYEELLRRLNDANPKLEDPGETPPATNIPPPPAGTEASHVRQVQLFFNDATLPVFMEALGKVKERFKVENITDAVFAAVCHCSEE